ncbi:MAG TPA: hypothetical protein LFV92_07775 [Rickettsia endosymbiont of Ceroptres masudai]|nr:hypothetical protein [Rickettsia endosymbiont of Ceroptres masudai]
MKITKVEKQIFKITSNIKNLVSSSTNTITKYLKLSEGQGYIKDVSHEFLFEKNVSELANFKGQNSFSDLQVVMPKEGAIDWSAIRKLIYARFADEIGTPVVEPIKSEAVIGISEEFKDLRSQGYDFKRVANLIEQKKGVVVNEYELEGSSNISNISDASLIERMKKLSIAGYMSNYAGDDGLRQSVEEVIIKKAACIDEIKSMFSINNGLSCENYDDSELVTLVGIEAM